MFSRKSFPDRIEVLTVRCPYFHLVPYRQTYLMRTTLHPVSGSGNVQSLAPEELGRQTFFKKQTHDPLEILLEVSKQPCLVLSAPG